MEDILIIVKDDKELTISVGDVSIGIDQHVIGAFTDALNSVTKEGGANYGQGCFLGWERERVMNIHNIQYHYELIAKRNLAKGDDWFCPGCRTYCDGASCGTCGVDETNLSDMADEFVTNTVDVRFSFC